MVVQYYDHKIHKTTGYAPVNLQLGVERKHLGILTPGDRRQPC